MKLTFLGTGTSYGVPYAGCDCDVCTSNDPRDNRLRSSILVEAGDTHLIVDTGPDFRVQCLRAGVKCVSAVLWTHIHNDHIIGLDDIRPYSDRQGYIDGYGDAPTLERLEGIFDYIFLPERNHAGFPRVTPHVIAPGDQLSFGELKVTVLRIFHGSRPILSYQFEHKGKRLVYATDCSAIPDETMAVMQGCEVFIVDALRHAAHPNHFSLGQALQAAKTVGASQSYFTHITHGLPYVATEKELPDSIHLAYDGLSLEIL